MRVMLPLDTPTVWHGWGERVIVNKCQRGEDTKTKQRPTKGRALRTISLVGCLFSQRAYTLISI